jgi:catechol 2,3-dioxygenase-like lactoylglutathione lyase family enzyme
LTGPAFRIGNLGEAAIRCRDLDAMTTFYRDILRLDPMGDHSGAIRLFRLAEGYMGHTQVVSLLAHDARREGEPVPRPSAGEASSLHHIALGIAAHEQLAAQCWLSAHGYPAEYQAFDWVGWRGLFTVDPDGNTVELVAHVGRANPITTAELTAALPDILSAPKTNAPIHSLCLRPGYGQRSFPGRITMTRASGIPGERWATAPWMKLDDGSPDPRIQVSILPSRVLELVWRDRVRTPHPGDPIVADLDTSLANMPTGTLIKAGTAVLRVSDAFNAGCAKWKVRYGTDARLFNDAPGHPDLRVRGVLCSVEQDGEVTLSDRLQVLR